MTPWNNEKFKLMCINCYQSQEASVTTPTYTKKPTNKILTFLPRTVVAVGHSYSQR